MRGVGGGGSVRRIREGCNFGWGLVIFEGTRRRDVTDWNSSVPVYHSVAKPVIGCLRESAIGIHKFQQLRSSVFCLQHPEH